MVSLIYKLYYKPRNRQAKKALRKELASSVPKGGVGVEVGVYRGHHAKVLLREAKPREMYLVDPWQVGGPDGSLWGGGTEQEAMEAYCSQVAYWAFHESQPPDVHVHIKLVREASPGAARLVPDEVDWVYLDGDHRYDGVMADLEAWWPKVRPGGVMWGDDWSDRGWYGTQVQDAVKAYFGEENVVVHGKSGYEQWSVRKPVVVG